jgi:hypothetical protein
MSTVSFVNPVQSSRIGLLDRSNTRQTGISRDFTKSWLPTCQAPKSPRRLRISQIQDPSQLRNNISQRQPSSIPHHRLSSIEHSFKTLTEPLFLTQHRRHGEREGRDRRSVRTCPPAMMSGQHFSTSHYTSKREKERDSKIGAYGCSRYRCPYSRVKAQRTPSPQKKRDLSPD